eukprot:8039329-Ditylum_brightwellii.AAC.1
MLAIYNIDSGNNIMSQDIFPKIPLLKQITKKKAHKNQKKDPLTVVLVKGINNKEKSEMEMVMTALQEKMMNSRKMQKTWNQERILLMLSSRHFRKVQQDL